MTAETVSVDDVHSRLCNNISIESMCQYFVTPIDVGFVMLTYQPAAATHADPP